MLFYSSYSHPIVKTVNALQNTFETECDLITQMITTNCYIGQRVKTTVKASQLVARNTVNSH